MRKKILHICLGCSFTPGMKYQDNMLSEINSSDGHDVTVIGDCEKFENGKLINTSPEDIRLESGVRLIRLPYKKIINDALSKKIRAVPELIKYLESIKPDIIFHHGIASWELLTLRKYITSNKHTKLYLDTHADFNNSAKNLTSRYIQYKLIHKNILACILPFVEKVFYVSDEARNFAISLLNVPSKLLEFYPLGGTIIGKDEKETKRHKIRKDLGVEENEIVFIHTGKLSPEKKTAELIKAFSEIEKNAKLIIAGTIPESSKKELEKLISKDKRILFLGWKTGDELIELMCASDVYVQPGSQSASLQAALCCSLPVLVYPHLSHSTYLKNNGFFVADKNSIKEKLEVLLSDINLIKEMSKESEIIAKNLLDYKKLAARIYI